MAWLVELLAWTLDVPVGSTGHSEKAALGSWLCPISLLCALLFQSGDTFLWPFIILAFAIVKYKK